MNLASIITITWLAPLMGAIISGIFGPRIGHKNSHNIAITLVGISMLCSFYLAEVFLVNHHEPFNFVLFNWIQNNAFTIHVGFYLDALSVIMLVVVSFVSFLVHIYSIGYMHDDPGYTRFFAYVSLFTFAMFALIGADNLAQLFFGWEGVGVVSYLLIGFYLKKVSAANGALKAFLVNRVGDLGLILAIGLTYYYTNSLDYTAILEKLPHMYTASYNLTSTLSIHLISLICFLFLIAAMGKSAQIPLHVWLPESMEGPTPISALIHAATMVTAGIYLICRLSPIFELTPAVLNIILIIGSLGALFLGLVGIVQNDIKRVVAYSTLSQLGYMIAATGASAYSAAMFHLITHACFKALLFLCAGSVIVAMHHEQDMQKMGGLAKDMPITYVCNLIGTLALIAFPFFSGFYSKDSIIAAVSMSQLPAASFAYFCLVIGAMVTAIYSFRAFFLTYHGQKRFEGQVSDPDKTITFPLIVLSVPSIFLGMYLSNPIFSGHLLSDSLTSSPLALEIQHELAEEFHSSFYSVLHAFVGLPLYFTFFGFVIAYLCYVRYPNLWQEKQKQFQWLNWVLQNKWGFDWFNDNIIVPSVTYLAKTSYRLSDQNLIDKGIVSGISMFVFNCGQRIRYIQTGYLYHQAFFITLGLIFLLFLISI